MPRKVITKPIRLNGGERGTFSVDPLPAANCRVVIDLQVDGSAEWKVMSGADEAGNPVPSPSDVGNFHQIQHSFGEITLEARGEFASGTLRMTILCPGAIAANSEIVGRPKPIPTPAGTPPPDDDDEWPLWFQILMAPFALIWHFILIIWDWLRGWWEILKRAWERIAD